ncbi:MAG: hypothetical protein DRR08_04015 [Candidatus Parabeggiatoa sp. nov. 2]|nr:MAG: hypothetical protein DRR08_04015 [Gammaproteobacteria bacterium]HEC85503.1 hypothetical protein [Thioploca sp.]
MSRARTTQGFGLWLSPPCKTLIPLRDKGPIALSPIGQIGPQFVAQHALGLGRQALLCALCY